ncbi:MAG: protein TonB [Sediminicola sp.]|jgi:protein TonB|tara:strand:- start:1082 stop:1816 length:735 start_codon:yes stop_codon:yes gene_type:complete
MQVKKYPKFDLGRNSILFFQIGMIVMLFISWRALEWKTVPTNNLDQSMIVDNVLLDEIIPITNPLTPPPPPPPPPPTVSALVIIEVEDEAEVEESVIKSTEADQDTEILDVAQVIEEVEEEEEIVNVPFAVIENVPIYPGCEDEPNNEAKKKCMSKKVKEFIQTNFNTELAAELGLEGTQKIFVTFKIDRTGRVADIRSRAPHPKLEAEAAKVVNALPRMIPGKQRGVPVGVLYALPIMFQVRN